MTYTIEQNFRFQCDNCVRAWLVVSAATLRDAYLTLTEHRWSVELRTRTDRQMCPRCTQKDPSR